jgi:hypothetical protein
VTEKIRKVDSLIAEYVAGVHGALSPTK